MRREFDDQQKNKNGKKKQETTLIILFRVSFLFPQYPVCTVCSYFSFGSRISLAPYCRMSGGNMSNQRMALLFLTTLNNER